MEKVNLPTKTKIAVGLLIILGLIFGIGSCFSRWDFNQFFFGGLLYIIMVLVVIFLLKAKKWAYWLFLVFSGLFSIIILMFLLMGLLFMTIPGKDTFIHFDIWNSIIHMISGFSFPETVIEMVYSIPLIIFILLLLDRKNFWKIAS